MATDINISIPGTDISIDTDSNEIAGLAKKLRKQSEFEGNGFDQPEPIQAISNAADELFDADDRLKVMKHTRENAELKVMGLMRASGRVIYKHRDRLIRITDSVKLKIESGYTDKKARKKRSDKESEE